VIGRLLVSIYKDATSDCYRRVFFAEVNQSHLLTSSYLAPLPCEFGPYCDWLKHSIMADIPPPYVGGLHTLCIPKAI